MMGVITANPVPIPIDAIRLVYPILDPETGIMKDTVINQLKDTAADMKSENMTLARWEHGKRWDRFVPGANIIIPWPEVKAPEYQTHDCDTIRSQVESRSFFYNLLSPPMPPAVIDELRNKYSKFRTRHEDWYLAQKEHEANAKSRRQELLKMMQTPSDEARIRRDEIKLAKGEPELTDEMLEKLGEIIAQTKAVSLKDSGVSEVQKSP
jgi:large subunit ribosomal protein L24